MRSPHDRNVGLRGVGLAALLFGLSLVAWPAASPIFARLFPEVRPPVYDAESFAALWLSHAGLVAAATLASALIGISAGVFVTRPAGRSFRPIADVIATIGQSCPPAAVLAVAVPALGYGALPTFVALAIYGLLPVTQNTIAGFTAVPRDIVDAARGIGLSPGQVLRDVELPLAAPTILAGLRTAVVINIGTATIGSTVGAITLGTPIIDGLVSDKLPYVIQGAVVVALFAVLTDEVFGMLDRALRRHRRRG
jgi:osmoprotectant transport system permease protein